ncbi:uncharacterized protein C8orf89 homolog isoform 2-T2 [Liasis olivaceus]
MSRSQQRTSLEQRDLQAYDGKLPEISCVPKCKYTTFQPTLKERKLPSLMLDNKFLDNKETLFKSQSFMNSWKNAVLKTKRIKQEYVSAYGLSDSSENTAMPHFSQGMEKYPAIPNPFPVVQKTQSGANKFPNSSDSNEDSSLPPLYLLPSAPRQSFFEGYHKSREDIAMGNADRKRVPQITAPLKNSELQCGAGDLGAVRLKKYNRCSSLVSFPDGSKFRTAPNTCTETHPGSAKVHLTLSGSIRPP